MLPKSWKTYISLLMILSSQLLTAQVKYSRVKINLPQDGMRPLLQPDLDLDHGGYNATDKSFTTTLHETDIIKLRGAGLRYEILVDDEVAAFQLNANVSSDEQEGAAVFSQKGKLHFENSCSSPLADINTPVGFIPGQQIFKQ